MISKELLSEVLGDEYKDRLVDWFQVEDNYLRTYYDCGKYDLQGRPTGLGIEINIHELAYLCKEWATFKNGKNIITERDVSGAYSYIIFMLGITIHNEYLDDTTRILAYFKADTEPEAVFKACQWILEGTYMQTTKLT